MNIQAEIDRLITVRDASVRLDCSTVWVRNLIADGKLPAIRTAIGYLIDPDDVEALRKEREAKSAAA